MNENISEHLQDSLVYLCITDDSFIKLVTNQVPNDFFSSDYIQETYKVLCKYYKEFNSAPKDHFHDELANHISKYNVSKELSEVIVRYISHLKEMFAIPPDVEYVLSRLNNFIREKTYIKSTYLFAELVEKNKFDEAQALMQETLRCGVQSQQLGVNYFTDDISRPDKPEQLFKLDIPEIDKSVLIKRSDFITLAGSYKSGKSWFGHYMGVQALKAGLTVVHVSHENSKEETTIRYDMMIGGFVSDTKEPRKVEITTLNSRDKRESVIEVKKSVYDRKAVLKVRKTFSEMTGGKLFIQKYPMGVCSPGKLDSFIEQLENMENVKVDVCITDYADIMAPIDSSKQTRDAINDTYIYLKRIADDRGLVMITMSQINDEGAKSLILNGRLEGRHLSEDRRKFGNIDKGLFVGTNDEYEPFNEYIVGCFANRNGGVGRPCVVGRNLDIGQFLMYSYPMKREAK